jgi:Tol biopolymer transport system component
MTTNSKILIFSFLSAICFQTINAQIALKPIISEEADIVNKESYSGVISEQYENGSPKLWKTLVNGKAEGLWLEWYPDGTLRYKSYWKKGLGHGRWEYYHPNGILQSESFYIEDIAQGIYRSYFNNGQLQSDLTYLDGKKNGIELIYDYNGTLIKRNFYENGNLVIDQPSLFELGNINDQKSNVWGICFSPDGKTAYFTKRDAVTNLKRIYETIKTEKGWSEPKIASFSTHEDESPFINAQGTKLFFASYRPLPGGSTSQKYDSNIWYVDKTAEGWSQPKPITGKINQSTIEGNSWPAGYEAGPVTDEKGNLYYWAKSSQTNVTSLYFAPFKTDSTFENPIELIELSSFNHFDSSPTLSPDGNILFFVSDNRTGGLGGSDIFYSVKIDGKWSKPKILMPFLVNSYGDDSFPSFSPDGKYFFYSSTKAGNRDTNGDNIWELYYVETKFLIIE